jgi:hypothetical protein
LRKEAVTKGSRIQMSVEQWWNHTDGEKHEPFCLPQIQYALAWDPVKNNINLNYL